LRRRLFGCSEGQYELSLLLLDRGRLPSLAALDSASSDRLSPAIRYYATI
jgi:hypothetical protein